MPHESTVAHEQRFVMESPMISRSRTFAIMEDQEEATNKHEHRVSYTFFHLLIFLNFSFIHQFCFNFFFRL